MFMNEQCEEVVKRVFWKKMTQYKFDFLVMGRICELADKRCFLSSNEQKWTRWTSSLL